jgi:ketosteroid isomerase-like protein
VRATAALYRRHVGENTQLLHRYLEAVNRAAKSGDLGETLTFFSDDVVWKAVEDAPDAGTYRGPEGMRGYFEDWLNTVDDAHLEEGEMTEAGDFVVADVRARAAIKGTDAQMELPYAIAVRFADGKIVEGKEFRERADALSFAESDGLR